MVTVKLYGRPVAARSRSPFLATSDTHLIDNWRPRMVRTQGKTGFLSQTVPFFFKIPPFLAVLLQGRHDGLCCNPPFRELEPRPAVLHHRLQRDQPHPNLKRADHLPAPSGANKKSFPHGALMQHLAPRRNPELSNGHLIALAWDPYFHFFRECGAGSAENTWSKTAAAPQGKAGCISCSTKPWFFLHWKSARTPIYPQRD